MIEAQDVFVQMPGNELTEVPDGYVLYQNEQERVHFLNPTAVIVYELCDGKHDVGAICGFIRTAFDLQEAPSDEVMKCLSSLLAERLISPANRSSSEA